MSSVRALAPAAPSTALLEDFERVTALVQSGTTLGFAIVLELAGGEIATLYHTNDAFRLLGALHYLQHRITVNRLESQA